MIEEIFKHLNLTKEQSIVYGCLLEAKGLEASKISLKTGLERTFIYKILNQLIDLGLIEKIEKTKEIARFYAKSPIKLKEMLDEKARNILATKDLTENKIGQLISEYNLINQKPNVTFIEGIDGIRKINDDIIHEKIDYKLIRSILDKKTDKSHELIKDQINKKVALGLKTKIVGPLPAGKDTDLNILRSKDFSRLVTRGVIENFEVPAQIIIYGNKVAITDFKNDIVTTIIENSSVRETFEKIFDFMFEKSSKIE